MNLETNDFIKEESAKYKIPYYPDSNTRNKITRNNFGINQQFYSLKETVFN